MASYKDHPLSAQSVRRTFSNFLHVAIRRFKLPNPCPSYLIRFMSSHKQLVDLSLLALLENVQVEFFRRLLGVHDRAPRAILFIETGVMPLKYRRIVLALRSVHKLLTNTKSEYALRALRDSIRLWEEGKPCYVGDIQYVLANLPLPVSFRPSHISNPESIPNLIQEVETSCTHSLYLEIEQSERHSLLHGLVNPLPNRLQRSAYLDEILVPAYRKALTLLRTSCHFLAIECLRWRERGQRPVPRHHRLCRFCKAEIETEAHALFACIQKAEIRSAREEFFLTAAERVPMVPVDFARLPHVDFLRSVLKTRVLDFPLGRLAHRIFTFYDGYPPYLLPQYRDA